MEKNHLKAIFSVPINVRPWFNDLLWLKYFLAIFFLAMESIDFWLWEIDRDEPIDMDDEQIFWSTGVSLHMVKCAFDSW